MNLIAECLFGIGVNVYIKRKGISLVDGRTYLLDPCGGKKTDIRYDDSSLTYYIECPRGEKFYWPGGEYQNIWNAMHESNYIKILSPVVSEPFTWVHYENREGTAIADYLEENHEYIAAKKESILVVAPTKYHDPKRIRRLSTLFGKTIDINETSTGTYTTISSAMCVVDTISRQYTSSSISLFTDININTKN